jgi:hypothetical protein
MSDLKRGDRILHGKISGIVHCVTGKTVWYHNESGEYCSAPIESVSKC